MFGTCSDLGLCVGADDRNRTRTVSLGSCPVRPYMSADLRRDWSASDRETPLITGVNGTLMARSAGADLHRHDALLLPRSLDRCRSRGLWSTCQGSRSDRVRLGLDSVDAARTIGYRGTTRQHHPPQPLSRRISPRHRPPGPSGLPQRQEPRPPATPRDLHRHHQRSARTTRQPAQPGQTRKKPGRTAALTS
jgi:hypothetical protein